MSLSYNVFVNAAPTLNVPTAYTTLGWTRNGVAIPLVGADSVPSFLLPSGATNVTMTSTGIVAVNSGDVLRLEFRENGGTWVPASTITYNQFNVSISS